MPRRLLSAPVTVSVVNADSTSFLTSPATYKGQQTFGTLSAFAASLPAAGGWAFLAGASIPSTKLRDVYATSAELDALAPAGVFRQTGLAAAPTDGQMNVWQSAAWNGFGFWYQNAGGHLAGYNNELLMLRVADPVGVFKVYGPQKPGGVMQKANCGNLSGAGDGNWVGETLWNLPIGQGFPIFDFGPHPEHHYNGWHWDFATETLVVGGDQQATTTDPPAARVHGTPATFTPAMNVFTPYGGTPKQSWTRVYPPAGYAPIGRGFLSGVQNADGTWSFRSGGGSEYQQVTLNPVSKALSSGAVGFGPNNHAGFGATWRDSATDEYYELWTSGGTSASFGELYRLTTRSYPVNEWGRLHVADVPLFLGASGANYDDNHPAGLILNGWLYLFGHPAAGDGPSDSAAIRAVRIELATGAVESFATDFPITGAGLNGANLTMNGFHNRVGFVAAAHCFVVQVSPEHDALVFRPPSAWGL